jgi:pimeloyl-ACP methyl ester carboxylesterase
LILESPFRSVASFSWRFGVPEFLVTSPLRTDRVLPGFEFPIVVLAGREDVVVPPAHGEYLATLNPRAMLTLLPGGHNSGLSNQHAYWEAIDTVLAQNAP